MKIKDDAEFALDDVLYDIFYGGKLSPERILENESDVQKVQGAICILEEYIQALEEVGEES